MKKVSILHFFCLLFLGIASPISARRAPEKLKQELVVWLKKPEVLAFLDVIAFAEGTYRARLKGYKMRYPHGSFTSYKQHPAIIICARSNGKRLCSTAAGRYMFLRDIWAKIADRAALHDFSPLNQDIAAVYLLHEKKTLEAIEKGDFEGAVYKVNGIWSSLPGARFGQPIKKMAALRRIFDERLEYYQKAGVEPLHAEDSVEPPTVT